MKKLSIMKSNIADFLLENQLEEKDETPAVKLLYELLLCGYENGASDIHMEPQEEMLIVRMRVDGILTEYMRIEKERIVKAPGVVE